MAAAAARRRRRRLRGGARSCARRTGRGGASRGLLRSSDRLASRGRGRRISAGGDRQPRRAAGTRPSLRRERQPRWRRADGDFGGGGGGALRGARVGRRGRGARRRERSAVSPVRGRFLSRHLCRTRRSRRPPRLRRRRSRGSAPRGDFVAAFVAPRRAGGDVRDRDRRRRSGLGDRERLVLRRLARAAARCPRTTRGSQFEGAGVPADAAGTGRRRPKDTDPGDRARLRLRRDRRQNRRGGQFRGARVPGRRFGPRDRRSGAPPKRPNRVRCRASASSLPRPHLAAWRGDPGG